MTKRALIINGSLRAGGNTDRLISSLAAGAIKGGMGITQVALRDQRIQDCAGCYHCYRNGTCAIEDDMQQIHRQIRASEFLVMASPLYWRSFTGLMKTFIDRLYLYYPRRNAKLIAGKKALIITPMYVNEMEHGKETYESEIEPIVSTYEHILKRLGIELLDMAFFSGLGKVGDAERNAGHIERAYELGEQLGTR